MKMKKIITILSAEVKKEHWNTLRSAYRTLIEEEVSPPGLLQSVLIQSNKTPHLWRIVSVWESMEAVQKMRDSGDTPGGVLVFNEAHVEPSLDITEVKDEIFNKSSTS